MTTYEKFIRSKKRLNKLCHIHDIESQNQLQALLAMNPVKYRHVQGAFLNTIDALEKCAV